MIIKSLLIRIIIKLVLWIRGKEVKIIDFHKSINEVLRAINGHVFIMHNQHFKVNHLKNYHDFDGNLY